jgi:choline-glycine betaine transporter
MSATIFIQLMFLIVIIYVVWGTWDFFRRNKYPSKAGKKTLFQRLSLKARKERLSLRTRDPFDPWDIGHF